MNKCFDVECQQRINWFLQAAIKQDKDKNIYVDQYRYGRSIVDKYIPNAPTTPTETDLVTYATPLPTTFVWTASDNSNSIEEVKELETQFGFRLIEVAGSLNYLANTCYRMIFAIRKLCRFTNKPGKKHFVGCLHMLHHLRCFPARAICFYHNVSLSPLANMLI